MTFSATGTVLWTLSGWPAPGMQQCIFRILSSFISNNDHNHQMFSTFSREGAILHWQHPMLLLLLLPLIAFLSKDIELPNHTRNNKMTYKTLEGSVCDDLVAPSQLECWSIKQSLQPLGLSRQTLLEQCRVHWTTKHLLYHSNNSCTVVSPVWNFDQSLTSSLPSRFKITSKAPILGFPCESTISSISISPDSVLIYVSLQFLHLPVLSIFARFSEPQ